MIIPDHTRTAPIDLMFRILYRILSDRVELLDFIVALGTHPAMPQSAILKRVGLSKHEWHQSYSKARFFNHNWKDPQQLKHIGTKALADAQNRIKARIQKIRQEKEKELGQLYQKKRGHIEGIIEKYEKEVETQKMIVLGKIEKIQKDIEARKSKEEDKLKDQAKDVLDDILK